MKKTSITLAFLMVFILAATGVAEETFRNVTPYESSSPAAVSETTSIPENVSPEARDKQAAASSSEATQSSAETSVPGTPSIGDIITGENFPSIDEATKAKINEEVVPEILKAHPSISPRQHEMILEEVTEKTKNLGVDEEKIANIVDSVIKDVGPDIDKIIAIATVEIEHEHRRHIKELVFRGFLFIFFILLLAGIIWFARVAGNQLFFKRQLPLVITFISGLVIMVVWFIPQENQLYQDAYNLLLDWLIIISSFALIVGVGNLLLMNFMRVSKMAPGWGYNAVCIAGVLVTAFCGIFLGVEQGSIFDWLYRYIQSPCVSTTFSILAFYVASAAFRAFRAKSSEATVLLLAAILVMLGRVSLGSVIWSPIHYLIGIDVSEIAIWINNTFTTAGQRAILLGAALGYISASFKILLGVERSYLGGGE